MFAAFPVARLGIAAARASCDPHRPAIASTVSAIGHYGTIARELLGRLADGAAPPALAALLSPGARRRLDESGAFTLAIEGAASTGNARTSLTTVYSVLHEIERWRNACRPPGSGPGD